jgi:hypothetical protein
MRGTRFPAITSRGAFYRGVCETSGTNWFAYCELYVPLEVAGLETYFEFH